MENVGIGKKLRKIRIYSGMTQQDLADALGATKAVISTYENDLNSPSFFRLIEIASMFHVSTDYLLSVGDDFYDERFGDGDKDGEADGDKVRKMNERHMGIGRQIMQLRKERGISRQELADMLNQPVSEVDKYERDLAAPPYSTLVDLAKCFHVSTECLLGIDTGHTLDISGLNENNRRIVKDIVTNMKD